MVKINVQQPRTKDKDFEDFARSVIKALADLANELNSLNLTVKNGVNTYSVRTVNVSGAGVTVNTLSGVTTLYIP